MEQTDIRVTAYISMDAIAHNFQAMKDNLKPGTKMIAVIKADGYGHGAVPIARMIEDYDYIWGYAVATPSEAHALRAAGLKKPILILGLVFEEQMPALISEDIRLAVSSLEEAESASRLAGELGKKAILHIALDTGMSRIGFPAEKSSISAIRDMLALPGVTVEGIFTHFARADEADKAPGCEAFARYQAFISLLSEEGIDIPMHHASNSAGIIRMPEANLTAVRAGITIYGIYPSDEVERDRVVLEPAMSLKSHVTLVKTIEKGTAVSYGGTYVAKDRVTLATVPVGYADGYPRSLSNKGYVLIRGQKAPICGRICMDQFMVDVSAIPGVARGDEVTLLGSDGANTITIDELGHLSGRFPYEFACGISSRVPRFHQLSKPGLKQ